MSLVFKYNNKIYCKFDCIHTFIYNQDMTISNNPIEQGGQIADHIVREPSVYSLEASVGKFPPIGGQSGFSLINAAQSFVQTLKNDFSEFSSENLIDSTDKGLAQLVELKAFFPVIFEFGNSIFSIKNATIKSYEAVISKDTYNVRKYKVELQDLMFSTLELTQNEKINDFLTYKKQREVPSDASQLYIDRYLQ